MATFKVVKLNFTSPLHLGKGLGEQYDSAADILHSDTISGAIASAFCHIEGANALNSFLESYRISSAFPFVSGNYFLPKPPVRLKMEFAGGTSYSQNKRLKKIEFIESTIFSELAEGNSVVIDDKQLSKNGKFLFASGKRTLPYKDEVMQRVEVPRTGGDANTFYFERRFFSEGCGLYFIYDIKKEFENSFKTAVFWLSQTGFGTDKSVGNGLFTAEFTEFEMKDISKSNRIQSLSLWCPEKEEINSEILRKSAYSLVLRGGFIAGTTYDEFRHLRKKSIYMFTEGSLFEKVNLIGKIENLRPEWNDENLHPVLRDGRAVFIPVNF